MRSLADVWSSHDEYLVIPAQVGIQFCLRPSQQAAQHRYPVPLKQAQKLDSGFRWNDDACAVRLVPEALFAAERELRLPEHLEQGQLVIGHAPHGAKIEFAGRRLHVGARWRVRVRPRSRSARADQAACALREWQSAGLTLSMSPDANTISSAYRRPAAENRDAGSANREEASARNMPALPKRATSRRHARGFPARIRAARRRRTHQRRLRQPAHRQRHAASRRTWAWTWPCRPARPYMRLQPASSRSPNPTDSERRHRADRSRFRPDQFVPPYEPTRCEGRATRSPPDR